VDTLRLQLCWGCAQADGMQGFCLCALLSDGGCDVRDELHTGLQG
jgi:hypothetical protein